MSNHILIDNAGLKREFDILIETVVNHFKINIAVECKDYKNRVSVEKIEAFEAKCNAIPQINKKIFVSRVGFQRGAIAKSKLYGIELLLLEKISESDIHKWLHMDVPSPISIERVLARPALRFVGEAIDFSPDDILLIQNSNQITILEFMKKVVEQNLIQPKIFITTIDTPMPESDTITLQIDFIEAYLIQEERKYQIVNLWFDVVHTYTNLKSEISFDKYRDMSNGEGLTESVTLISENQDIYSFVKRVGRKEIDIISKVVINSEEKIVKVGEMKVERIEEDKSEHQINT